MLTTGEAEHRNPTYPKISAASIKLSVKLSEQDLFITGGHNEYYQ